MHAQCDNSARLERKDHFPILLHVDHRLSIHRGSTQRNVEPTDARLAVIGVFALSIRVMNDRPKAHARADGRPLKHLEITVGVSERGNRAAANGFVDSNRLACLVVDKIDLR